MRVPEIDRSRFRISSSRVKSPQRSFAKLSGERYRARFTAYEQVPEILDDLIGVRLICNNLSDINTFQEIIGELPLEDGSSNSITVEPSSQRDYFAEPKPSGYRAFHVNFVVPVPQARDMIRLRVEVQVRTLLQDGWGELTHEDTYKPGSRVPDWIVTMSQRMAELLAAVDSIAQDLRTGLDVETQKQVDGEVAQTVSDYPIAVLSPASGDISIDFVETNARSKASKPGQRQPHEDSELTTALISEVRAEVVALTRPIPLAMLSQNLAAKFGTEITQTWAEFGGFRKLLESAVPEVSITGPSPGYVHPLNDSPPTDWEVDFYSAQAREGLPSAVRALRTYEKGMPLVSTLRMSQLISAVEEALKAPSLPLNENGRLPRAQVVELAKRAREVGDERGQLVVRPHAVYVLQTLSSYELLRPGIAADEIRQVMVVSLLNKAERYGLVSDRDAARKEISLWLGWTSHAK